MLSVRLIEQVEQRGDPAEMVRLAAYSEALFVYYANQVPLIFAYKLADNAENRRRRVVGRSSGFRRGVRSLNYVPEAQHPANPSAQPLGSTIRYYDQGRQKWRSFRKGNLVSISAFWSEELQYYVDTPEEAGITAGAPFESAPRVGGKPVVDEARQQRSEARQVARRARESDRNALRQNDRTARADRRRQNSITRSAR